MITDLSRALRDWVVHDLPINNNEIDISFDPPKREWSSRLSGPTLNFYLHALRDSTLMKKQSHEIDALQGRHNLTAFAKLVWVELDYKISAWTNNSWDEHNLLLRTFMILNSPELPERHYSVFPISNLEFEQYPAILINIIQQDIENSPYEFWQSMDNEFKPTLDLRITMAVPE